MLEGPEVVKTTMVMPVPAPLSVRARVLARIVAIALALAGNIFPHEGQPQASERRDWAIASPSAIYLRWAAAAASDGSSSTILNST